MLRNIRKDNGNAALTAVIALSAILIVAGVSLVAVSVDFIRATKEVENDFINKASAVSCLEEALYKLSVEHTYTGTVAITMPTMACQGIVTTDAGNPNLKNITITSTIDNHTYSRMIVVDVSGSTPVIIE